MRPTTVLLISSPYAYWAWLEAKPCALCQVCVVGEAHRRGEAARLAADYWPDITFASGDFPGLPIVSLARELRTASPPNRIVAVGTPMGDADRAHLAGLGVSGVLLLGDVTEGTLGPIVEAVRHNLRVASMAAVDRSAVLGRQQGPQMGYSAMAGQERGLS